MPLARPMFPPPVRPEGNEYARPFDAVAASAKDGHRLADIIWMREQAATMIERLLAFLDATEAPEDFDDDEREEDPADDEPSLGAPERHPFTWMTTTEGLGGLDQSRAWSEGGDDDREGDDCEDEGAQCEDEGAFEDNGIGDLDGLLEQYAGSPLSRAASGRFATGYATSVE